MKYFCASCDITFHSDFKPAICPICRDGEAIFPLEIEIEVARLMREAVKANAEGKTVVILVDGVEVDRIEPRVR